MIYDVLRCYTAFSTEKLFVPLPCFKYTLYLPSQSLPHYLIERSSKKLFTGTLSFMGSTQDHAVFSKRVKLQWSRSEECQHHTLATWR